MEGSPDSRNRFVVRIGSSELTSISPVEKPVTERSNDLEFDDFLKLELQQSVCQPALSAIFSRQTQGSLCTSFRCGRVIVETSASPKGLAATAGRGPAMIRLRRRSRQDS